jgi:hypothetical protein
MADTRFDFAQVAQHYCCLLLRAAVPFRKWRIFFVAKRPLKRVNRFLLWAVPGSALSVWMRVRMMLGFEGGVR